MTEIIGIRFKRPGKIYFFDPHGIQVKEGQGVIVETSRGVECGFVRMANVNLPEEMIPKNPKPIIRIADEADLHILEENKRLAQDAFDYCEIKIVDHHLEMKLIGSEYTFDKNKLIFYFTADNRVDFRELVKDLARVFRTRIELRQVGVRDHAKLVGGIGSCGQEICCHRFMNTFDPVSIKMAKIQGLSLNPNKISGICGRLMCCLNYEQEHYLKNAKKLPRKGSLVLTEDGQGYVVDLDVLQERVRIHVYNEDNTEDEKYYYVSNIEILEAKRKGSPRPPLRKDLKDHVFTPEGKKTCEDCMSCASAGNEEK